MAELSEFDEETQMRLLRVGFVLPHEYPRAALLDFLELFERHKRRHIPLQIRREQLQKIAQRHGVRW